MFGLSKQEKNADLQEALRNSGEGLARALARGADPNLVRNDQTALMQACAIYDSALAEASVAALLEHGADPNRIGPEGRTALHYAVGREGRVPLISRLLEAGADITAANMNGETPLMLALRKGHWREAKLLLDNGGENASPNTKGETPLHIAFSVNTPADIMKLLLASSIDVNAATRTDQNTALHSMVGDRNNPHYRLLLEHRDVALNKQNRLGNTPLHNAIDQYNTVAALLLLEKGAMPELKNNDGHAPLQVAALRNMPEVVEYLVSRVGELDGGEKPEATPLAAASGNGIIRAVKAILGAAEARQMVVGLDAPLYAAACNGHARVMELLIAAGADVNYKNENGITPLMIAAANDQAEALELLIKSGADPAVMDKHNLQAYDYAVSNKRIQAKEILGRFRRDQVEGAPDDGGCTKLNDHSLEVREGQSISMTFNFWTQQVMIRDLERPAPLTVINFSELQRQQAVDEAFERLRALGGNPPDPRQGNIPGKTQVGPALPKLAGR